MAEHNIFKMKFGEVYDLYLAKVERKGRRKEDVDEVICWLTGDTLDGLESKINEGIDMEAFIKAAPSPNPNRSLIKGSICGVKIVEIEDPIMKELRYMDKLVDELAKGKAMDKILRK